jgi:hypothetical protein
VWPDAILLLLPDAQRRLQRPQCQIAVTEFSELVAGSPIGALQSAIELGRAGRQDEAGDGLRLARSFVFSHDLAAPNVERASGRGAHLQCYQKLAGGPCSGAEADTAHWSEGPQLRR